MYHWESRFKEDSFVLVRGVDYDIGDASIVQQARNAASIRGVKVSIQECNKGIIVTVTSRKGVNC
jgi:hypothetical protein